VREQCEKPVIIVTSVVSLPRESWSTTNAREMPMPLVEGRADSGGGPLTLATTNVNAKRYGETRKRAGSGRRLRFARRGKFGKTAKRDGTGRDNLERVE